MKKILTIIFLGVFLFFPIASLAAVCCVCTDGATKTVQKNAGGQLIFDMFECGDHGAWGKPCSISEHAECTANPATTGSDKFCCLCTDGDKKTVARDDGGQSIRDSSECGSRGAIGKPCSISESNDCATTVAPTPVMTDLAEELGLQNVILGVAIPNLHFSAPPTEVDEEGNVYIPWAGEYIKAIYNFAVVVISILAVVVLILSGAQIITSAGGPAKGAAYKRITQAIIGLFIAWGSYVVLYTINPGLTTFNSLKIKYIETNVFEYEAGNIDDADTVGASKSGTPQPALKKVATDVANKLGFNACLFQSQVQNETNWIPTRVTGCCAGLGQVSKKNAKDILNNSTKRTKLISLHSEGCPKCPAVGASTEEITTWLTGDPEGNLIASGMIRKSALGSAPNPIAAAAIYGMGGSYKHYLKTSGCSPAKYDTEQLFTYIREGKSTDELVTKSCIPPVNYALQNNEIGSLCEGTWRCCKTGTENTTCDQPPPRRNEAGLNMGRWGTCKTGSKPDKKFGQTCYAVAGAEQYIKQYMTNVTKCASTK